MEREMQRKTDWIQVLIECKNSIKEKMRPLAEILNQPQRNLGIGAGGDPIKEIDLAAETAIDDTLKRQTTSFSLISEESGTIEYGQNPKQCYVTADPIDGTTNLLRGVPFYATSIAVSTEPTLRSVHAGLVADLFHDITYTAKKGHGSYRNGHRITPSKNSSIRDGVIGLDLNSYRAEKTVPKLTALMKEANHLRHFGANALEMCYVADGTTDAFIDIRGKLRTTDMAAAQLIIREAGAIITTPEGKTLDARLDPKQKVEFIAAANQVLHRKIVDLTRSEKGKR